MTLSFSLALLVGVVTNIIVEPAIGLYFFWFEYTWIRRGALVVPPINSLVEYQIFFADCLRHLEVRRAKGDPVKLEHISAATDSELLIKWLWIASIVAGPVCFLIIPFALSMLSAFIWSPIKAWLWLLANTAMIAVFMIFLLALYFTTRAKDV